MRDFISISNRLLQSNIDDYEDTLRKFIRFIERNDLIYNYIESCGKCKLDIEQEFQEVYNEQATFFLGDTEQEEVRNIYAILKHIADEGGIYSVLFSYSSSAGSSKDQAYLDSFNSRVVEILINHINSYLEKLGINMGIDNNDKYNITLKNNGQINISNDNSTLKATNIINETNTKGEVKKLLDDIRSKATEVSLSNDDKENVNESLDAIESTISDNSFQFDQINPSITTRLKPCFKILGGIKFSAELISAITQLALYFNIHL